MRIVTHKCCELDPKNAKKPGPLPPPPRPPPRSRRARGPLQPRSVGTAGKTLRGFVPRRWQVHACVFVYIFEHDWAPISGSDSAFVNSRDSCERTNMKERVYVYVHIYMCVCIIFMYVRMYVHICMYIYMWVYVCRCAYIYIYKYSYVYIYIYTFRFPQIRGPNMDPEIVRLLS